MLGAVIGDIAGSRFERRSIKTKDFTLISPKNGCRCTDDSIMTVAVAEAILACDGNYERLGEETVKHMQIYGKKYPYAGYGGRFKKWIGEKDPKPYNSFGNGAAMRVSPCAYAANTLDEAIDFSHKVTEVTHNHEEGIKGAEATTVAVFMAIQGKEKDEIGEYIDKHYYPMDFSLDSIRDGYRFDVSCQGSVPQSIKSFLESDSYEDAVRNAISLGGDADTMAAIAGSIAEAYYGIPTGIRVAGLSLIDKNMAITINSFEEMFGAKILP